MSCSRELDLERCPSSEPWQGLDQSCPHWAFSELRPVPRQAAHSPHCAGAQIRILCGFTKAKASLLPQVCNGVRRTKSSRPGALCWGCVLLCRLYPQPPRGVRGNVRTFLLGSFSPVSTPPGGSSDLRSHSVLPCLYSQLRATEGAH